MTLILSMLYGPLPPDAVQNRPMDKEQPAPDPESTGGVPRIQYCLIRP